MSIQSHLWTWYLMEETGHSTVQCPTKVISVKRQRQVGATSGAERGTNTTGVYCHGAPTQLACIVIRQQDIWYLPCSWLTGLGLTLQVELFLRSTVFLPSSSLVTVKQLILWENLRKYADFFFVGKIILPKIVITGILASASEWQMKGGALSINRTAHRTLFVVYLDYCFNPISLPPPQQQNKNKQTYKQYVGLFQNSWLGLFSDIHTCMRQPRCLWTGEWLETLGRLLTKTPRPSSVLLGRICDRTAYCKGRSVTERRIVRVDLWPSGVL